MMLKDYSSMENTIREKKNIQEVIPALLLLLHEAKDLLFTDGKYRKLKWHQFKRIWKLAKFAIRFINTLMAIFK